MFQKLHNFVEKRLHGKQEQARLAVSDDEVVLYSDERELWRFRWDAVTRIEAYKRDLFSTDLVCLDFYVAALDMTYPTHEEVQGFVTLREQLSSRFPSVGSDWLRKVTLPPFAPNHKVLYERPAA
jgi:hypothetical protein